MMYEQYLQMTDMERNLYSFLLDVLQILLSYVHSNVIYKSCAGGYHRVKILKLLVFLRLNLIKH